MWLVWHVPNHEVEGRLLPNHVAGHPALELCNTRALWGRPDEHEYLTDIEVLALWAREHEILTPGEAAQVQLALGQREQVRLLRQVKELRGGLFHAATAGAPLDTVHRYVARAVSRAAYADGGRRLEAAQGPAMLLDRLALHAHDLLTRHGLDAVGLCASEACGWVFLDPTGRRRWCTMALCGNRAKARRFAARHASYAVTTRLST